ncbi:hypothetical protein PHMEG_0006626 [Phytophthora megakarya]|uniref:Uncharacterized protein n=1 Tax=Phytophthora megakarya TaxID=4795 RepID=A0A225WQ88_9STRA|nr:hypothetical protein PHMEG_0006626 [Phytophthora megakarya]
MSIPITKKQLITPAFLRLLYRQINFKLSHQRLVWGYILVCYFFLLRRSEYLKIEALTNYPSQYKIGLEWAKNNPFGRTEDQILCLVRALQHVVRARPEMHQKTARHLAVNQQASEVAKAIKGTDIAANVPA